jgi:hypothetical protein
MKQEAGGWPEWCQNENDRWSYIRNYHEKEGILLDYNNIKRNPGLRTLAKLMLMLYSYLEQLGPRALYADTDSSCIPLGQASGKQNSVTT